MEARNLAMGPESPMSRRAGGQKAAKYVAASIPAARSAALPVLLAAARSAARLAARSSDSLEAPITVRASRSQAIVEYFPGGFPAGQAPLLAPVYVSAAYARIARRALEPLARLDERRGRLRMMVNPWSTEAEARLRALGEPGHALAQSWLAALREAAREAEREALESLPAPLAEAARALKPFRRRHLKFEVDEKRLQAAVERILQRVAS